MSRGLSAYGLTAYDLQRLFRLGPNGIAGVDIFRLDLVIGTNHKARRHGQFPNLISVGRTDVDTESVHVDILEFIWKSVNEIELFAKRIVFVKQNFKIQTVLFNRLAAVLRQLRRNGKQACAGLGVLFNVFT